MSHRNEPSGLTFLAGALLGGLVGAGIGLLFAPAKGEETRKKLQKASSDAMKNAEFKFRELKKEHVEPFLNKAEKEVKRIGKDLEHKFNEARENIAEKISPEDK